MRLSPILHATAVTQPIAAPPPSSTPVLVVGGGPVGLSAALDLAWRGVESVLVEPRRSVSRTRPRAKTTDVRTMEALRRWGLADELRRRSPIPVEWSDEVVFCESLLGAEITRVDGALGLTAGSAEDWVESGQQAAQFIVEDVLRGGVVQNPLITGLFGWRVTGLDDTGDGVDAQLTSEAGASMTLSAQYVIAADGARSLAREAIGARMVGNDRMRPTYSMVIRAPGLAERVPHGPAVHYWVLGSETAGNLGRLDLGDIWWLGVHGVDRATGDARATELVHDLVGEPVEFETLSVDPWVAQSLVASRMRRGRILLVGDAAHMLPPWGGHGYNTGVGDAVDAAWKIAAVMDGYDPALLDSYEAERRPYIEAVRARSVSNMASLAVDLSSMNPETIRARKAPEFRGLALLLGYRMNSGWGIAPHPPAASPGPTETRYEPVCVPGARLPHGWLSTGESLYDRLARGFVLLTRGEFDNPDEWMSAAHGRLPCFDVVDLRAEPAVVSTWTHDLVLVRPDLVIAWTGDHTADPDAVVDNLLQHKLAAKGQRA